MALNQQTGMSNGVLGYLGVKPEQYTQARALMSAGVPSLNNADRLSGLSSADMAKRQAASTAGTQFLNGDALVSGGAGRQNTSTPGFQQFNFGGVQSSGMSPAPTPAATPAPAQNAAIVSALRQRPTRFAGYGMGVDTRTTTPQAGNLTQLNKSNLPSGLFQPV